MSFNRIILSTDENPTYMQFWPFVADAWHKFFPSIPVSLAFVTDREENDPLVVKMRSKGEVMLFKPIVGVPSGNHAKVVRYLLSCKYINDVNMCYDIDSLPLQNQYMNNLLKQRKKDHILAVGAEVYLGTSAEGKFPAGYITGEGYMFQKLFNPSNLSDMDVVKSWVGLKVCDHKESISNEPNNFSDESLIRALIQLRGKDINVQHVPRNVADIRRDWVDRSWWGIDAQKLFSGGYIECSMLRPFEPNYERMVPLIQYIYGKVIPKEEIVLKG